ncbi:GAF domain-containing protein [Ornithinimicrobium cavernae]|uniref:sensor histidine kinase n=1 Tax=Ornithinimicrobium cavernae TaxID=2666047 RepID=UPI000D6978C2|nr:GAF domain-containing protein [Ornithinimicrobium cavernae]
MDPTHPEEPATDPIAERPLSGADFEDLVREVVHRMHGVLDEQARLRLLLDAVVTMAADLSLDSVLSRIVTIASRLVNARYAALGVLETDSSQRLRTFVHQGISDDQVALIGDLPRGHGLLGLLIDRPEPVRLHDIAEHPQSYGFPPNHPPMHSFLGVPVLIRDQVFGNLYLTEKGGGVDFTAQDEEIVVALAAAAGVVIENARLYEEAARRQEWLSATSDMVRLLSGSADAADAFNLVADCARTAAEADVTWIVTGPSAAELRVIAVSSAGQSPDRPGAATLESPLTRLVVERGEPLSVEDVSSDPQLFPAGPLPGWPPVGAAIVVPLGPPSGITGALGLAWTAQRVGQYRSMNSEMPTSFARQAALALQLVRAREDQHRLVIFEDRDRIARDLHDVVIQRLFAIGLGLQAASRNVKSPEIEQVLEHAVDELDTTIKDIRRTIFALGATESSDTIQAEITRVVDRAATTLGFHPQLRFEGPVRTLVRRELVSDMLAVLAEALSNTSRHAVPSMVTVTLAVSDEIVLTVADNGRGMPEGVAESGLANIRHRAERHGGRFRVESSPGKGTILLWTVPTS